MSLEKIDVASGDAPSVAAPIVPLAEIANFGSITASARNSDVTSLGFPELALNVEGLFDRCRTAGPDAGSCIKSVKRQIS